MMRKIYIIGPVGSGKSTLAKQIEKECGIAHHELDGVVHGKDASAAQGNRRRPPEERDALFALILAQPNWVMEDTGRACFEEGRKAADAIILLSPRKAVRTWRIVRRWILQKLGIEPCGYTPGLWMLKKMLMWSRNYENGSDGMKQSLIPYEAKTIPLRTKKEVEAFLLRLRV